MSQIGTKTSKGIGLFTKMVKDGATKLDQSLNISTVHDDMDSPEDAGNRSAVLPGHPR